MTAVISVLTNVANIWFFFSSLFFSFSSANKSRRLDVKISIPNQEIARNRRSAFCLCNSELQDAPFERLKGARRLARAGPKCWMYSLFEGLRKYVTSWVVVLTPAFESGSQWAAATCLLCLPPRFPPRPPLFHAHKVSSLASAERASPSDTSGAKNLLLFAHCDVVFLFFFFVGGSFSLFLSALWF